MAQEKVTPITASVTGLKEKPERKKRERIVLIERMPQPDWFVTAKNGYSQKVWYLRLQITGLHPCRFGPFPLARHLAIP